jgi:PTS system mannose-specific IIA component
MSDYCQTFIIAHSNLAKALLSSVEKILGKQEDTYIYSNEHDSMTVLAEKIETQIKNAKAGQIVCFTDLKGGSCWTLASMLKRKFRQMTVISGVNLPMLTTYFNNRHRMAFSELIDKTISDGCRGITKLQDI